MVVAGAGSLQNGIAAKHSHKTSTMVWNHPSLNNGGQLKGNSEMILRIHLSPFFIHYQIHLSETGIVAICYHTCYKSK